MRSIVASLAYYRPVILEVASEGYERPAALRRCARRSLSPLARAPYDCFDTHLSFFPQFYRHDNRFRELADIYQRRTNMQRFV